MEFSRLRMFVAVADAGSFTAAADQLGVTKSAVSQGIAALEQELGTQILQRSTRRLAITQTGEAFLADCRALLGHAEDVIGRARAGQGRLSGLLRITSDIESARMVAPLLAEYRARHPDVRIEYLATDELLDLIKHRIDVGFRVTGVRDSLDRAVTLAEMQVWCAASPRYVQQRGMPTRAEQLPDHEWIAFTRLPMPSLLRFRVGKRTLVIRTKGKVGTSSTTAGRELALAGAGIFSAPHFILSDDIDAGRLVRILPDAHLPPVALQVAWHGRMEPPARARVLIDLAKTRLGSGAH